MNALPAGGFGRQNRRLSLTTSQRHASSNPAPAPSKLQPIAPSVDTSHGRTETEFASLDKTSIGPSLGRIQERGTPIGPTGNTSNRRDGQSHRRTNTWKPSQIVADVRQERADGPDVPPPEGARLYSGGVSPRSANQ